MPTRQPRSHPLRAFTLPADVDARMRAEAKRRGVSYSALVAEALRAMLGPDANHITRRPGTARAAAPRQGSAP